MGIISSTTNSSGDHTSIDSSTSSEHEYCLPDNVLVEILSYVPSSDLIKNCAHVCVLWRDLVVGHGVWKQKCIRDGRKLPSFALRTIPKNFYRNIYLHDPFERNLLKNPSGEELLEFWQVEENGGDGWKIEDPPVGSDEVPKEAGTTSCFATSYGKCLKYQVVDLFELGVNREILQLIYPVIVCGEWHSSRFDCGSVYNMGITLLDQDEYELYRHDISPITEEQWTGRSWSKTSHTIDDYSPDLRFIIFDHSGQDTQFWSGHYGSKMAGAYVKLLYR